MFLKAEDIHGYFSSVFTSENISALSVPGAEFQEAKSDYLGQLIVPPEMVGKKMKTMKYNNSHGVDGVIPILLKETAKVISVSLTSVFNLSLIMGVFPFEWKEANTKPCVAWVVVKVKLLPKTSLSIAASHLNHWSYCMY